MTDHLVHPLLPSQIEAANAIHDHHMPGWAASDAAIAAWAARLPDWDEVSALAKAAVINDLYSARHDRLVAAAGRICRVMQDPPADAVALVEAIAHLDHGDVTWEYVSFASKVVHFYMAPEEAPIYDGWAVEGLRHHFGRLKWAGKSTYAAFVAHVCALRDACIPGCSLRDLDRYLWLSGMYRAWLKAEDKTKVALSGEVRGLFGNQDPPVKCALTQLLGEAPPT